MQLFKPIYAVNLVKISQSTPQEIKQLNKNMSSLKIEYLLNQNISDITDSLSLMTSY